MTTTSSYSTAPDAARREQARQHFAWQENVSKRRDLSATVRLAAWALALRRNAKSGRCDPSYADLADHMGNVSTRTAIRAVRALERAGLVALVRDHGRRNQFTFLMPEGVTEFCQGSAAERGDKPAMSGVTSRCHPNMRKPPTEVSEQRERENAHAREASRSAARAPVGAASEERTEPAAARPAGSAKPAESDYQRLREVWIRPWCDSDIAQAWLEYDRVTREVDPRVILAGARKWVQATDAPRFLPSLCRWLTARGWERPPPGRGRPRQEWPAQSAPRGGKVDLARMALIQGRLIREGRPFL